MIADDESQIVEGLRHTLDWASLGIENLVAAKSYSEAVKLAVACEPHIALLDVCLGEQRGYDIVQRLADLSLPTHCLMMSGYEEFEYARRAMHAGARGYLLKPIDRQELKACMTRIIVEDLAGLPNEPPCNDAWPDPVLRTPCEAYPKLTQKLMRMVAADYGADLTLKSVADQFRMNGTYLGQIFLRDTGLKFSEYVSHYRLLKARELIERTDAKISVIARRVGYGHMGYFYTQFKELFSISPSDLRAGDGQREEDA